jgi:hypothetical protein
MMHDPAAVLARTNTLAPSCPSQYNVSLAGKEEEVKRTRPKPVAPQPFEDYAMPLPLRKLLSAKELDVLIREEQPADALDSLRFDLLRLEPSS